ncbi:hypothetical protein FPV67DRAFT_1665576 [Lyophyllum atratum]|nr:hypothetical protein FPV67DRAFT_1665576 [Lyophyllum atratum]
MAQAQRLSEQVKSLNSRVRELEAALAHNRRTGDTIDAQTSSHSDVCYDDDGVTAVSEAIGSLSLGLEGQAKYHGESAGSEYLQDLLPREETQPSTSRAPVNLPDEILALMHAFPFGLKDCPYNKSMFIRYLPSRQRTVDLACIYYRSVAWMYDPISSDDFSTSILEPIYGADGYPSTDALHSHRLAVFFMVLANGNLYDSHPSAVAVAEHYYALARAALSLDSVLLEVTCATVQALFLVFRFSYNASQADKEERWLLTGLATRVAHTIGLLPDGASNLMKYSGVAVSLFWELFTWENWSSLVHGRPGSLFIQHADCKFPEDLEPSVDRSGERELGFHAWKFRYSAECLSISVEHVFSTRAPPYSALMGIDQIIRNYAIPRHLRCPDGTSDTTISWSRDPAKALQQYCALCVRDSNLLYIHRSYFAQAIREASDNPLRHKYKPSVLATYQTSCRLINALKDLYPVCPLAGDVWFFWSGIFSSCVVLGALVVKSPGCALAKDAMRELETALPFFEDGSQLCRPPLVLAFLQKLYRRAAASYTAFRTGRDNGIAADSGSSNNEPDDLEVVGGRKAVITTKSNPNSPSPLAPGSPSTLNQEAAAGSSPASQRAAPDMSVEYHRPVNTSANVMRKNQDIQMEENTPRFEDHAYSSIGKGVHHPASSDELPHRVVPDSYIRNGASVPVASDVRSGHSLYAQTSLQTGDKVTNEWHTPYPLPHHPYAHQTSSAFLAYGHSVPVQSPHPGQSAYGYQSRTLHEQNQEEIWRSFMLGFGP